MASCIIQGQTARHALWPAEKKRKVYDKGQPETSVELHYNVTTLRTRWRSMKLVGGVVWIKVIMHSSISIILKSLCWVIITSLASAPWGLLAGIRQMELLLIWNTEMERGGNRRVCWVSFESWSKSDVPFTPSWGKSWETWSSGLEIQLCSFNWIHVSVNNVCYGKKHGSMQKNNNKTIQPQPPITP